MPDALDVLRTPTGPVAPDPAFANRLRERLERELGPFGGPSVSNVLTEPRRTAAGPFTRTAGLVPFVTVAGARQAIDWYVDALGAEVRGDLIVMPDGRIGHSDLAIAGRVFHVADESPASHVAGPQAGADATVTLGLEVSDVDAAIERAVTRGATLERAATDYPYGRNGVIRDPFNHRWMISTPTSPSALERTPLIRNGDVGYASLWVADIEKAERFYGAVLGWKFAPAMGPEGRRVVDQSLSQGLWAGQPQTTLYMSYFVDDMDAALERVRVAGGRAEEPKRAPWGTSVDCADDQGSPFSMFQPPSQARTARDQLRASKQGDLEYIAMQVIDSARARAFYSALFGWDFTPGRFPDAWNVIDPVPMTGISGGQAEAKNIPVYRVDDVAAAVQRIRNAGGKASDPKQLPYGTMSYCEDDQGTAFHIGAF